MKAALQNHHARMQRVLDHIDRHLDDDLGLDALSSVAAYSKYHFHRQFTAAFGLSVHCYIQLARMKRASSRLGYADASAFTRAFTRWTGKTPGAVRKDSAAKGRATNR